MISVPAEDFAGTMEVACRRMFTPFTPTVCGVPVAPWEQPIVGVLGRVSDRHPMPILFGADGREYCFSEITEITE